MRNSLATKLLLALALAVAAVGFAACGDDDDGDDSGGSTTGTTDTGTNTQGGQAIVIKTHIVFPPMDEPGAGGKIVSQSTLGDSSFCPGGTFTDHPGQAPLLGVVKSIKCTNGTLTITFDPNPTSNRNVQTGPWRVVSGTGSYKGLTGGGQFKGVFEADGSAGSETFTGSVSG